MAARKDYASRKPQSAGVGESKRFNAPDGTFSDVIDWTKLTVQGQPIPEHLFGVVPYASTDQGREEMNAGKEQPMVQFLTDAEDKIPGQYREDLLNGIPERAQLERELGPEGLDKYLMIPKDGATADPLAAIATKHLKPGQSPLFLSERRVEGPDGTQRGVLNYEIAKDPHGNPVKIGGMVLGFVPTEAKNRADQYYRDQSADKLQRSQDQVTDAQQGVIDSRKLKAVGQRKGFGDALNGITSETNEQAAVDFTAA